MPASLESDARPKWHLVRENTHCNQTAGTSYPYGSSLIVREGADPAEPNQLQTAAFFFFLGCPCQDSPGPDRDETK